MLMPASRLAICCSVLFCLVSQARISRADEAPIGVNEYRYDEAGRLISATYDASRS